MDCFVVFKFASRNMKVRLPEDIENDFLVQFFDELCARKAVRAIGKIKDKYSNVSLIVSLFCSCIPCMFL